MKAIAFYLASAADIQAEYPRSHLLPAFCHVYLHHARFTAQFPFSASCRPTLGSRGDQFKNIFRGNNSRDCEKLIPKRRRALPVECAAWSGNISEKDFSDVTERSLVLHRPLHSSTCALKSY